MLAGPIEDVVIDTSVLLAYVRRDAGEQQDAVDVLFDRIVDDQVGFFLLDLSIYEVLNVLVRKHGYDASVVGAVIDDLVALADDVVRVTPPLARSTAELAELTGLTGYDAAFLTAARALAAESLPPLPSGIESRLATAARELLAARGRGLVVAESSEVEVQQLVLPMAVKHNDRLHVECPDRSKAVVTSPSSLSVVRRTWSTVN